MVEDIVLLVDTRSDEPGQVTETATQHTSTPRSTTGSPLDPIKSEFYLRIYHTLRLTDDEQEESHPPEEEQQGENQPQEEQRQNRQVEEQTQAEQTVNQQEGEEQQGENQPQEEQRENQQEEVQDEDQEQEEGMYVVEEMDVAPD